MTDDCKICLSKDHYNLFRRLFINKLINNTTIFNNKLDIQIKDKNNNENSNIIFENESLLKGPEAPPSYSMK